MKKRFLKTAAALTAVCVLAPATTTLVPSAVRAFNTSTMMAHLYNMDDSKTVECLFYSDLPSIPYMNILDYIDCVYVDHFALTEKGGGIYELESPSNEVMTIDTGSDRLHFNKFEDFFDGSLRGKEEKKPRAPYLKNNTTEYVGNVNGYDLDLGSYGIDITEESGKVCFPLTTLCDIFSLTYHCVQYSDGELYFYEIMEPEYYTAPSAVEKLDRAPDLARFSYNELCFVMDKMYGKPSKSRLPSLMGDLRFDEFLSGEEYSQIKELLLSENLVEYFSGLSMLDNIAYDGGHTAFSLFYAAEAGESPDSEFTAEFSRMISSPENKAEEAAQQNIARMYLDSDTRSRLSTLRDESVSKLKKIKEWTDDDEQVTRLYTVGDTAVFVFDQFKDEMVEPFKWSLDYAKEHKLKNFLIDLTTNSGGETSVAEYMMTMMTNFDCAIEYTSVYGNVLSVKSDIDRNLDDVIDENDDISYDLNFAVLTSRFSFSCANLLPVLAKDSGIAIIGEKSGGGTCMLIASAYADFVGYSISGPLKMTHNSGMDVDSGAAVDYELVNTTDTDEDNLKKLYDFKTIENDINDFYAEKPSSAQPTTASGTTAQPSEKATEKSAQQAKDPEKDDGGLPFYIIIIAAAVIFVIMAVETVIILRMRRNRPPNNDHMDFSGWN